MEPPEREGEERPRRLVEYLAQLRRVAELPVDMALPGHGPFITDVPGLVAHRMEFHEQRSRRVLESLQDSPRTAYDLSLLLFPSLDPVNRFLAVSEIIGHLDVLELQGAVISEVRDGVRFWSKAAR